jgi:hypothetical protein
LNARGDLLEAFDLPAVGEGTRRRVDAANLADLFQTHGPYAFVPAELVNSWPKHVASTFHASARARIFGVIGALAIPLRHVSPAQWKRAMRLNDDAETLRARAAETWPTRADQFVRNGDHNRAETCLVGLYGLKNGGLKSDGG